MDKNLSQRDALSYIRAKVDQLLMVMGTFPLRPEELDDETLIALDPIGIIAESFQQVISHLEENNRRLSIAGSVFAHSYNSVVITDANKVIIDVNPAFTRLTGYSREETIGQTPKILASGRQDQDFYARMWKSLREHDFWQGEIWNRRKNGEVYPEMLAISAVRDNFGALQHFIGIFSDISLIKAHEAELHCIAYYDLLTGVPNRRLLSDRLEQAISRARRNGKAVAICYLDIDGFKLINDHYGHAAGDRLLVAITTRLKEMLRAEDTLARQGGDEFVLLLNDLTQTEEIHFILDRVLTAVSLPTLVEGSLLGLTASMGVTLYPQDDSDAETLLRHADHAMYLAKEGGKNQYYFFDAEHDRQVKSHHDHLQRLRRALEGDEFVLHYQPKVDLITGEVIGAEALIRWQHPEKGLLPPADFLHYLNGTGLDIAVGDWVIESALNQIEVWNAMGMRFTVSVNISADHLLQPDFSERLRSTIERHPNVVPGNLELEVLETAALSDLDKAMRVLTNCRQLGVHFALDDFGTGYSSLTYFRSLPIDTLKVDQSFVQDMLKDPNDLCIVEGIVQLANVFNRPVIAEGVETLEHGAILILLGCRLAQGYGIARPMPAERMAEWLEKWHHLAIWKTMDSHLTSRDAVVLVVAGQSLRIWIDKIVEELEHLVDEATLSLDSTHCNFWRWYQSSGMARYGKLPEFLAIAPLHERVHSLATELMDLGRSGKAKPARERLSEL